MKGADSMKKIIHRETLAKWLNLAKAWGSERADMCNYYDKQGTLGGYAHDLCKEERWRWYEDDYDTIGEDLIKQGYATEYLAKVWEKGEKIGYEEYEGD